MNNKQIGLVQQSYEKLIPISLEAGELFYRNLFELDPSLRAMFKRTLNSKVKN